MIETLPGGLLGGAFRLAPEVLKWLDRKGERGHELAMQDTALEFEKLRGAQRMSEIGTGADAAWNVGAIDTLREAVPAQGQRSRVRWADALSISVRPMITYWFMALYCAAKTAAFVGAMSGGANSDAAILHAWTEADQALWAGVLNLLVPGARVRPGAAVIAVPQAAIDLAKRFEGFHRVPRADPGRAHPYVCPAGYWTIGYGHLCDPKHPPIMEAEAEGYRATDLMTALNATLRYCPVLATEPEGRLAAIVDFTFNLGAGRLQASTLRRRVNQRDWAAAVSELRRWVYGGGKVLPGLVVRRAAETSFLAR